MKTVYIANILIVFSLQVHAESYRGPPPSEQKHAIHSLAEQHDELKREVQRTENGYEALTTSENPELVKLLQAHVDYMKKRMDSGAMVRRWDPAFVELVENHKDIIVTLEIRTNGVAVVVVGATADAIKVAQNHSRIISGFVGEGAKAVHRNHGVVLFDE